MRDLGFSRDGRTVSVDLCENGVISYEVSTGRRLGETKHLGEEVIVMGAGSAMQQHHSFAPLDAVRAPVERYFGGGGESVQWPEAGRAGAEQALGTLSKVQAPSHHLD